MKVRERGTRGLLAISLAVILIWPGKPVLALIGHDKASLPIPN
jgi:hypothetical protein